MSFKLPEPIEAERSGKRTASDLEEENGSSSEDETLSSSKESLQPRKKRAPSSSTWSEHDDEADSSCLKSRLASSMRGNFSPSQWTYKDLMYINIFYEDFPEPLEKFIKDVKDDFRKCSGFSPDPSKITIFLKKQLEKSLTFSYDIRKNARIFHVKRQITEKENVKKEVKENIKRALEKCDVLRDNTSLEPATEEFLKDSSILMNEAVQDFAQRTLELMEMGIFLQQPMFPTQERERGKGKRRGERARGGQGGSRGRNDESNCMQTNENICQHYCRLFGRIFFLKEGFLSERPFTFKNQTVRNTPDIIYHFNSGEYMEELLFIIEVKKAPLNGDSTDIRQLVGEKIMGQVGAELIGQIRFSAFYPHSFGVICVETKLIFVLLKISKEHSDGIFAGDRGTGEDPGKIHYTEPFDMLVAEDRSKIADFMFWLGFVQDARKYKKF
ncbi:uncharacterized protein LOC133182212 [Saccostrea echinata]|uniref:uncharacterized protein LOC133182212 n=1 Tax=Saccostrea echinata TaxID=191078 RepID=UPI002A8197E2|nr:uncharacterized protein LOC133182212 [Saccostrea echinata]